MKTLLWLDDIRDPFVGDWLMSYAPRFAYGDGEVVWVKNFDEFVSHIKSTSSFFIIIYIYLIFYSYKPILN